VLNLLLPSISVLFTLNGLGYLALLGAYLLQPGFLAGQKSLIRIAFIAYTVVTIVAWVAIGEKSDLLGIVTKIDEIILVVALWADRKNA
jgi:hypothetical protein